MEAKITFEKTSCYFCNEWLDDKTIKDHLMHCGQVLEKCPNNCLSYIQRKNMERHLKFCTKRIKNGTEDSDNDTRISLLEENLMHLRKILNEEIKMRHNVIVDLGDLKRHNQATDEWTDKVNNILNMLQHCFREEKECRQMDVKNFREVIDNLLQQFQDVRSFREEISTTLSNIETKVTSNSSVDQLHLNFEGMFNQLRMQTSDDINDCVKYITTINNKLNQMETHQEKHQTQLDTSLTKSISSAEAHVHELIKMTHNLNGLNVRYSKTDYEVKQLKNVIHETEDKSEKIDKQVEVYKVQLLEMKQNLLDLQEHLKMEKQLCLIINMRGHMIWKIDNYAKKLSEAKECSEITLKSPLFTNRQYGYTLRLDVHLNGVGTWKNRNLIATLTVVDGEYDTLLPWPCKLKADIILRDQPDDIYRSMDITKLIVTKKGADKIEYQNQYIHIPHSVISSRNYLKNDAIIVEVKVTKTDRDSSMS